MGLAVCPLSFMDFEEVGQDVGKKWAPSWTIGIVTDIAVEQG